MRNWLYQSRAEHVLVVAFDHVEPRHFAMLAETLVSTVAMFDLLIQQHERETLEQLVEILMPKAPLPPHLLKEAGMLARAKKSVLESTDWLTANNVAQLAGLSTKNPSAQPNKWKKQRQIFAVHHGGVDYFPGYGFDPNTDFRPLKAMGEVQDVFGQRKDSWGLAYWFLSDNSFLGGSGRKIYWQPTRSALSMRRKIRCRKSAMGKRGIKPLPPSSHATPLPPRI